MPSPRRMTQTLRRLASAAALALVGTQAAPAREDLPRVMSLNVCTDQLLMLIAEPSQILSLSFLARDATLSPMHDEARAWPKNDGLAEQAVALGPDLVVTGSFSTHNTTMLMRRAGLEVEEFRPNTTPEQIREDIQRIGRLLKREGKANEVLASFDAAFARARASARACADRRRPTMLSYGPNGVTEGAGTLADAVMTIAGFDNLASGAGLSGLAYFPLETLIERQPDLVLTPVNLSGGPSLADLQYRHPALAAYGGRVASGLVDPALWTCGGPFTARAVEILTKTREEMTGCNAEQNR